ncbi:replicative DNA helicase [Pseudonocardia sp. TRM90224]|uniref:replicative DNA helicase n=1 Tax=Pseudonocardia sp. TRM90224 TaxID=2812678 RepID=UPI00210578A1|nr:replicative DNA helicase [Pseudonocardia sp. TRM90224]
MALADDRPISKPRSVRPSGEGQEPAGNGAFDRQPPQDLTAEQSVLGGMLLSKDAIADVVEVLQPDDFYRPAHQTVYDCILDLYGRGEPADAVTVSAELQRRGELIRLGGAPYLHTLIATVPTAANAAYYAEIVAEKAILRRLVEAGTRIVQLGYHGADGAEVSDVVDRAQAAIYDVTERSTSEDYVALEELLQPTMDEIDAIASRGGVALGVPTGFADLDAATNGLHAGQMIVVAARPGLGKALALDTPLPTPEGWTTMGEVEVGALLLDAAGRPTRVVAATDVLLERPCFEITFSDGAVLVADAEHQWLTSDGVVRTTRELAADGADQAEHAVRMTAALQLPDQDLPLGPYTLGYWLGDGDVDSMSFQMMSAAGADHMAAEGHHVMELPNRRWGFAPPGEGATSVDALLKSIGVLDRKHLPAVYLRGSEPQRRALLAGLMDTRGKVTATGDVEFFAPEQAYLDDVLELVVSLGYPCSTPSANKLSITADENIFRVGWQRDRHRKRSAGGPVEHLRRIVEVRSVPTVPVRCVEVDNAEHLYLAGRSMIPTHNSTLGLDFARSCSVKHGLTSAVFSLEMSKSEIVMRLLSAEARIRLADMRAGRMSDDDWTRMARRMSEISEAPLFIDDSPNLTLMEIRAKARRLKQRNDLKLVILDYLQLMSSGRKVESRQQEVSEFSRQIKLLAKEIEVPVVAISQLNRGPEQRTDKRPMLSDLRESGCLTAGTRLLRADTGAEVAFGDLLASGERNVLLWSLDERMRMVARTMSAVFPSGVKDVFRLRLASGREVEATASHRFMTFDGWCQLGDLAVGDKLATPRRVPAPVTPVPMPEEQVVLLAHLIGDGSFVRRQPLRYASTDEANLLAVASAARSFGVEAVRDEYPAARCTTLRLPAPFHLTHGKRNPIAAWLDEFGLFGLRSHEKFVPAPVFTLPDEQVALFLRHLWATDGSVSWDEKAGLGRVYYSSTSRRLVDDVSRLLLRFGVLSRLKRIRKAGYRDSWHLHITGSEHQRLFVQTIGVHGARGSLADTVGERLRDIASNTNLDTVPRAVWGQVRTLLAEREMTHRGFAAAMGSRFCGSTMWKHSPSRSRLARAAAVLEDADLEMLATNDVFWDEIVEITELGEQAVYDATVPATHNFVANGIVAHNSIEQDADMVILLHRPDAFERDDPRAGEADLILAKHRNGPTSTITVAHQLHYSRFADLAHG